MNKKITSYWKLLRVNEWFGKVAIITILALSFGTKSYSPTIIFALYLINIFNNAFSFGINDIEDANDDALDPAKVNRNPLSANIINKNEAIIVVFLTAVFCLAISSIFNLYTTILCLASLTIGFLYSYKPVRLKSKPFLDLISHGFFLGFAQFLVPAVALDIPMTPAFLFVALMIFANSLFGDLYNEIRDYKVDRATNIRNTASIIDLRQYESQIHILHLLALSLTLIVSIFNLNPNLRLQIIIIATILFVISSFFPQKTKKRALAYSEPLMTLASLIFLFFIL